jgi:hypothetical protein
MIRINLLGQTRPRQGKWSWNPFTRSEEVSRSKRNSVFVSSDVPVPPPDRRPSLRMLADTALIDDLEDRLGFKPFADAIAGIIDSPRTATPLVMAINAKWGAGKTTLGQMIRRRLQIVSHGEASARGDAISLRQGFGLNAVAVLQV